jgi:hypothetical protein
MRVEWSLVTGGCYYRIRFVETDRYLVGHDLTNEGDSCGGNVFITPLRHNVERALQKYKNLRQIVGMALPKVVVESTDSNGKCYHVMAEHGVEW